jgi:hypothetical protein
LLCNYPTLLIDCLKRAKIHGKIYTTLNSRLVSSFRRIGLVAVSLIALGVLAYAVWQPGLEVHDGHNDKGRNAIWIAHGWLGADDWFTRNQKTNAFAKYRDPKRIRGLATKRVAAINLPS